jgi:hypothetical protein
MNHSSRFGRSIDQISDVLARKDSLESDKKSIRAACLKLAEEGQLICLGPDFYLDKDHPYPKQEQTYIFVYHQMGAGLYTQTGAVDACLDASGTLMVDYGQSYELNETMTRHDLKKSEYKINTNGDLFQTNFTKFHYFF